MLEKKKTRKREKERIKRNDKLHKMQQGLWAFFPFFFFFFRSLRLITFSLVPFFSSPTMYASIFVCKTQLG